MSARSRISIRCAAGNPWHARETGKVPGGADHVFFIPVQSWILKAHAADNAKGNCDMIIFGWGHVTKKLYGPTMAIRCPTCNNDTWLQLYRYRKWFTLFFIPVIPYSSAHFLSCSVCSQGVELSDEQVERAQQLNALTIGLFNEEISKEDYWRQVDKIEVLA